MRIPAAATAAPATPQTAFNAGEHVKHPQFGEGIVVSCEAGRNDQVVTVAFKGGAGVKRLLLSFAPLEKVAG
jgi:DNA helicase-2/ATP-dependent DNA helicase PcrA